MQFFTPQKSVSPAKTPAFLLTQDRLGHCGMGATVSIYSRIGIESKNVMHRRYCKPRGKRKLPKVESLGEHYRTKKLKLEQKPHDCRKGNYKQCQAQPATDRLARGFRRRGVRRSIVCISRLGIILSDARVLSRSCFDNLTVFRKRIGTAQDAVTKIDGEIDVFFRCPWGGKRHLAVRKLIALVANILEPPYILIPIRNAIASAAGAFHIFDVAGNAVPSIVNLIAKAFEMSKLFDKLRI